jgi:hypothetical protein
VTVLVLTPLFKDLPEAVLAALIIHAVRLDPRKLLAWYYALRGLAVAFAVFYGLDRVATVPPTVALTADHFGRERVGIVFAPQAVCAGALVAEPSPA